MNKKRYLDFVLTREGKGEVDAFETLDNNKGPLRSCDLEEDQSDEPLKEAIKEQELEFGDMIFKNNMYVQNFQVSRHIMGPLIAKITFKL